MIVFGVNLGAVMVWLREHLPDDAILCNGAGNYAAWIHRFYRFRRFATHIAPTSASMGYGMPAAVAMKRLYPERTVISVSGDGDCRDSSVRLSLVTSTPRPNGLPGSTRRGPADLNHSPHARWTSSVGGVNP